MPALLTARNLPQTLLLTILFLLIAVTSTLLACGPVAQPVPGDSVALPAAQVGGGSEPTAGLAAAPAITPTLVSGRSTVETPTAVPTDTPMPPHSGNDDPPLELTEPAITPTLERENPTAEPPTATPTDTPTPSQTPMHTDSRFDSDLDPPPPKPTRKYPNIGNPSLHRKVIEFEKAQQTNGEASEQEAGMAEHSTLVELELTHNAVGIAAWLKERGISPSHPYDRPVNTDDLYIAVIVPLELLGELSQQEGVRKIWSPNPRAPAMLPPPP